MKKNTKQLLLVLLVIVFALSVFAACTIDQGTNNNSTLYNTYKAIVENKGYTPLTQQEFDEIVAVQTADGLSITSVNVSLNNVSGETDKLQWMLEFVMSDGSVKSVFIDAGSTDVTPDPKPNPTPTPDGNDGSKEHPYTIAEAIAETKKLAQNAHSDNKVYVKGYITEEPTYYSKHDSYNVYLADSANSSSKDFMLYSVRANGFTFVKGDLITAYGHLIHFVKEGNSVYEMGYANGIDNPIVTTVEGSSKPTPTPDGNDGLSADKALTVEQVLSKFANLAADAYSDKAYYLKGTIIWSVGSEEDEDGIYSWMYLADGNIGDDDETYVYVDYFDMSKYPSLAVGDEVVVYGYFYHVSDDYYGDYITMSYYTTDDVTYVDPVIVSVKSNGGTTSTPTPTPDSTGHDFPSYFTYGQCLDEGCNVVGRKSADGEFQANFKYTLTDTQVASYLNDYTWMKQSVADTNVNVNTFYDKFYDFGTALDEVYAQSQIAEVLYYTTGDDTNYNAAYNYYSDMYDKYFEIIALVNSSSNNKLKSELANNVHQDDIDYANQLASANGVAELNNKINQLLSDYNSEMSKSSPNTTTIYNLYQQYVNLNNQLAAKYGYDNFMEYSYANDYGRDYTPEQTKQMSNYVLTYVAPLYKNVVTKLNTATTNYQNKGTDACEKLINGFLYDSLFASTSDSSFEEVKSTIDYINRYFTYLDNNSKVNFVDAVEDLFKTGNYFIGETEGAFTYYLYAYNKPILYFDNTNYGSSYYGDQYYYTTAFTFTHEFGHYYENIHNGNRNISMDFCETQSQGNEMLLLAWLGQNCGSATVGYELLKYAQLESMLNTILLATAVDEFEQAVYTNTYEGFSEINANNYQKLFDTICNKYGLDSDSTGSYWYRVCFDSAAYYISYAMSALPSVEIYAKAVSDGLDSAKNAYLTLFTNSNEDYNKVLAAAGLHNPFEEDLYKNLSNSIK